MKYARMFLLQGDLTTEFEKCIKEAERECEILAFQVVPLVVPHKLQPTIVVTLWVLGNRKETQQ